MDDRHDSPNDSAHDDACDRTEQSANMADLLQQQRDPWRQANAVPIDNDIPGAIAHPVFLTEQRAAGMPPASARAVPALVVMPAGDPQDAPRMTMDYRSGDADQSC